LNVITLRKLRRYVERQRRTKRGAKTTMTRVVEQALNEFIDGRKNAGRKFIEQVATRANELQKGQTK
jgi:translation initiation factor 2B subunit (eIF-2B alpha/beta/delta family)